MNELEAIVIKAIAELLELPNHNGLAPDTQLQDLGIDSGLMLELFLLVEESVPTLDVDPAQLLPEHFTSVASLADFVGRSIHAQAVV
ncbi:phosphopantetheine-binding protein [Mesorhizobium loti]|nr:phosphopantetheine-binding protein [Mesorhizobium loti]PLP59149.1 phosphopantetheine-binding protein [Mesorhizobium loti]